MCKYMYMCVNACSIYLWKPILYDEIHEMLDMMTLDSPSSTAQWRFLPLLQTFANMQTCKQKRSLMHSPLYHKING